MSQIRTTSSSLTVVIGYLLVAVGSGIAFVNFLTEQLPYTGWADFYIIMINLAPALVAMAAIGTWLLLAGILEDAGRTRARWGLIGFSLQTFFLALVSVGALSYFVSSSDDAFLSDWVVAAESILLTGGLLATVGFIVMAVRSGSSPESLVEDVPSDGPQDPSVRDETDTVTSSDAPADEVAVPTAPV